jgi:epoxyqueuosine reductase
MNSSREKELTNLIKKKAYESGFDLCGIAPVRKLEEHEPVLRTWCSAGMNGGMAYLGRNIEKRIDPSLILPGVRSVIVTGLNYFTEKKQGGKGIPVISRYAYGKDYHDVIIKKLGLILEFIRSSEPLVTGKAFVDSAPLLEKAWAREAGLGWPGRHSIIINRDLGSFFFIGVLLVDISLEYDKPYPGDRCGECRFCIESCPTNAINENRTIDARKCISYLTIEDRGPLSEELAGKLEGRVYGCDICQNVCPWNKNAKAHTTAEFNLSPELENMTREEWLSLTPEQFNILFRRSSIKRAKYKGLMKNIGIVSKASHV